MLIISCSAVNQHPVLKAGPSGTPIVEAPVGPLPTEPVLNRLPPTQTLSFAIGPIPTARMESTSPPMPTHTKEPNTSPTPTQTPTPSLISAPTLAPAPTPTQTDPPVSNLVLHVTAAVTGHWSDGSVNLEFGVELRNYGDLKLDQAQRITVSCSQYGQRIQSCGEEINLVLPDGFGPARAGFTERVPVGDVSFDFEYGAAEPSTLEHSSPQK